MRSTPPLLVLLGALTAGCAPTLAPRAPANEPPRPLWELAPEGASVGLVVHDGALARALELYGTLRVMPKSSVPGAPAPSNDLLLEALGIDKSKGAAFFAWPQRERGLLMVLPLRDRADAQSGAQQRIQAMGDGYRCLRTGGRFVCARSLNDIYAAVAPHEAHLARVVSRLPAEERGDIEVFASPRNKEIAHLRERARSLGLLTGVAASVRFRADGASLRVHVLGTTETAGAKGLAGAPPPAALSPLAAGATTVVRAHFDPASIVPPTTPMDARTRSELVEQLAGDVEVTTSGAGVAGAALVALLRDPERVERYVKQRCADTGGTVRKSGLDRITVTEHGCAARFDPTLMLLPVAMKPVPITVTVEGRRLVVLIGEAREPSAEQRAWEALVEGEDARRALTGSSALLVYTRRPIVGPDVGASRVFKEMLPFFNEQAARFVDIWSDIGAHVYQALLTAHVSDEGVVFQGDFTTFAPDPPEARAAYDTALEKRARGDERGYLAALAEIEERHPGTRAARRAAETRRSAPYLGAGVIFLGVLGGLIGKK